MDNMFTPLTESQKQKPFKRQCHQNRGNAIMPVPDNAPKEIPEHYEFGAPSYIWPYKNTEGQLLFYVCRFIATDDEGKINKEDRPLSYREFKNGERKWAWRGVDAPRPIYGLDRLANKPDALVIICEGEKAADAATNHFSDAVGVTSPNGAGSPHKADWSALKGRDAVIWPDNDAEGEKYAESVGRILYKIGAQTVNIVDIPDGFSEKWDLADLLPDGVTKQSLSNLLSAAYPAPDVVMDILAQSKTNTSRAFESDAIKALSNLKQEDPAHFETVRKDLKKSGVRVTELDKHLYLEIQDEKKKLDQLDHAYNVINEMGEENILSSHAHVWRWMSTGVWKTLEERALKKIVQSSMKKNNYEISRGCIDSVCDVLKTEIYQPEHEWDKDKSIINTLNGELVFDNGAWILKDHHREHYRTTQIPIEYDANATAPRFEQFLGEIFDGDADRDDKRQVLLELIGYTLVSHAKYEKFGLLIGGGANGKSVVLEVIKALVGMDNVVAVQPSQFDNKFQRAYLHLKLANLVTEIKEGGQIADAELKSITSGELTTAEHKNQSPFSFEPFCTCWFGSNHMPHTRDFSDALFRRAIVIPFNNTFKMGENADPNLKDKLLDELQGILNMALGAYANVIINGAFTEPQSCLDAKEIWRKNVDQVAQFVEDRCVLDPQHKIESKALYEEYKRWADEGGISRKVARKTFTLRLVRLGCSLKKGSGGTRMIQGIRIGWKA